MEEGTLSSLYERLVGLVADYHPPSDVEDVKERIGYSRRVISVGMGRSGDVAEVFAKFLRNAGIEQSFGPFDIPYIFNPCDTVIAFTGSGFTSYTNEVLKYAKDGRSYVVVVTGNRDGEAAKYADKLIVIPGGMPWKKEYYITKVTGEEAAPLTPMGTLFELRSLLFSLSLIGSIRGKGLVETHSELIEKLREYRPREEDYLKFYGLLPKASEKFLGKVVVIGEGLSGIVGRFFVTRLRHLAKGEQERQAYFWLDRGSTALRAGDLAVFISGSSSDLMFKLAERVKGKGASVVAVTSFPSSRLSGISDYVIEVPGRVLMKLRGLRSSYYPSDPTLSAFELRALFFLESFVHYVARIEGITENDMRSRHSELT